MDVSTTHRTFAGFLFYLLLDLITFFNGFVCYKILSERVVQRQMFVSNAEKHQLRARRAFRRTIL